MTFLLALMAFACSGAFSAATVPESNKTCCVDVTLYDTFGDGWGENIALQVKFFNETLNATDSEYLYYSCANQTDNSYHICYHHNETITLSVAVLEEPALEPWEIYWVLRNNGTSYFVGDIHTVAEISCDSANVTDPVDYENRTCHTCVHPKPKPKAAPKDPKGPAHRVLKSFSKGDSTASEGESSRGFTPKPKEAWPFPLKIFDEDGDGWFNESTKWVQVPSYGCNDTVNFYPDHTLPVVLTGPEYIISTIDRVHDVRRNTLCGEKFEDVCEERLIDGKYIFRVTGALSLDDDTNYTAWEFCGREGTIMQELEFKLVKGRCYPGPLVSASELCCEEPETLAEFSGTITLSGVLSEDLSEFDYTLLEHDISESLSNVVPNIYGSVIISSAALSGSDLVLSFDFSVKPSSIGMSGLDYTQMGLLATYLQESASAYVSAGSFLMTLQSELKAVLFDETDVLSHVTAVTVSEIKYVDSSLATTAQVSSPVEVALAHSSVSFTYQSTLASFERSAVAVVAALLGGAVFALVVSNLIAFRNSVNGGKADSNYSEVDLSSASDSSVENAAPYSGVTSSAEVVPDFSA